MTADAIRFRLRVIRAVFLCAVLAALGSAALVFGFRTVGFLLLAAVVILVIVRRVRETSLHRRIQRADRTRIDQASPANAAGFTRVGIPGLVVQIAIVLLIDALLFRSIHTGHAVQQSLTLALIGIVLTVFVIVIATLTMRLRALQERGMIELGNRR